jgi:hypothetical protein
MTGRSEGSKGGSKRRDDRKARNAQREAEMDLAKALASVFAAGVYTKEELQAAVCIYVSEMKASGQTGEGVVRSAQGLVNDVRARYPSTERTKVLLSDMVTWCLAEYYRESA